MGFMAHTTRIPAFFPALLMGDGNGSRTKQEAFIRQQRAMEEMEALSWMLQLRTLPTLPFHGSVKGTVRDVFGHESGEVKCVWGGFESKERDFLVKWNVTEEFNGA